MNETQDARRSPVYCCYCGTPYPLTDQMRTSGPIICETCGGAQYVGTGGRSQSRYHIIEVICPNRKCSERTLVNKLEREGKTKTGCHACDEQILIQTDNQGKLKGISLIKKTRTFTTKQWLGISAGALVMGLLLGWLFTSPAPAPASASGSGASAERTSDFTGGGSGGATQTSEPSPSPVANGQAQ